MKDSIIKKTENGEIREFKGGKEFVEAVAKVSSKEELRRILKAGGVDGFDEEELEESYRNLALSQNWEAVKDLFEDKDYESCSRKLSAYGIAATKEQFELISEVVASASDDALISEILHITDMEEAQRVLYSRGYYAMTPEFLLLVQENAVHFYEDALLTDEEIKAMSGTCFYERCRKSINLIFALSTIAGLALGTSQVADPALLIAIAGGISLMYGKKEE